MCRGVEEPAEPNGEMEEGGGVRRGGGRERERWRAERGVKLLEINSPLWTP